MELFNKLIGLLSNECYILILGVLFIAYLIINSNNKHQQAMEDKRLNQLSQIFQDKDKI